MDWKFLPSDPPFGMAHRGGEGPAPENTRAAFAHAVKLGYSHVETDVHLTSDGELVAFHDVDLERSAGIEGRIADHTWAEIAEIELDGGHHIPLLEELLIALPNTYFNIDPKVDDAVEPLAEMIRLHDAVDRVCVGAFSDRRVTRMRQLLGPGLCTSPGPSGMIKVLLAAVVLPFSRFPYGCIQTPTRFKGIPLDHPWLIARLHTIGLQVHYWTINNEAEMERLIDAGADGIITDELELLKSVLQRRGLWSTDPTEDRG